MRPILALALAGCQGVALDDDAAPIDGRVVWSTERPDTVSFLTPDYEVPPYSDYTVCTFLSYTGGDVAIPWAGFYQNLEYGHHVVLMTSEADEDDFPDGMVANCTDTNADIMVDSRPFLFASDTGGGVQPEMALPDGMAVKLKAGERFVVQSHYINTTDAPVLVNDAVFLQTAPVETVETWAAPWVNTQTDLAIPVGKSSEVVDCAFDQDLYLLSMLGHLHEWGSAYAVDHVPLDGGPTKRVYDIPAWDVQFRDAPPIQVYDEGAFPVKAGDRFLTTCSWDNDTGETLGFPHEMCATVGFAYPLVAPVICEP